jgi:two-component system chemotaxis sensor kinase CheA
MEQRNLTETFLTEAEDLLVRIEEIALNFDPGQEQSDAVNQLFRAFHTLKGSGAMFGFEAVAAFTHHVETVLDKVRDGVLPVTEELIALILRSKDQIKALLDPAQDGRPTPDAAGAEIVAALNTLLTELPDPACASRAIQPHDVGVTAAATTAAAADAPLLSFRIHFRPALGLMASGTNPILLLNELRALGQCQIAADIGAIPPIEQLQPDQCHLAWDITLVTGRDINAIKDVFFFVENGSDLVIQPSGQCPVAAPPVPAAPPAPRREGQAGVSAVTAAGPAPAAATPIASSRHLESARKSAAKDASIRVPSERLDRLVSLVGELVMNQSRLSQVTAGANVPNLTAPVEELERLVDELRDNVLGIRMMPIGATFNRFKRLIHDLSRELGKEIDLVSEGAETELDKTVLDQLGDPLVHLIRNSLDHGIEPPEERLRLGKSRSGTVRLAAAHVGSNVVITIQDDGRGIDLEAVRTKAVEKGIIAPEAKLSERELYDLVFLPGVSTAKKITNVSGRGVGMDVVKRQFDALRGQVSIASESGKGTTLTLTLPLTLAIIEGLLVEVGRDQFIVPLSVVTENVELQRSERGLNNGRTTIPVRGDLIPYIRLRDAFEIPGHELDIEKIVIARHGHERVGLVVDRVLGTHQTVIQSLGRFYRKIELVSGATIMGDGRVALILDLAGLVQFARNDAHSKNDPLENRPVLN